MSLLSYVADYVLFEIYNSLQKRFEAWIVPTSSDPKMVDWLGDSTEIMYKFSLESLSHDISAIPEPINTINFPTKGKIIQLPSLSEY